MAYASTTATTTGGSSSIYLPASGDWIAVISSGTWGDADLQVSIDDSTWADVTDSGGSVENFTANGARRLAGGAYYRLDVNTHSANITLAAEPIGR